MNKPRLLLWMGALLCALLSAGCASFELFSGDEERGALFAAAVRRWAGC